MIRRCDWLLLFRNVRGRNFVINLYNDVLANGVALGFVAFRIISLLGRLLLGGRVL